jgi:hypothetical protein
MRTLDKRPITQLPFRLNLVFPSLRRESKNFVSWIKGEDGPFQVFARLTPLRRGILVDGVLSSREDEHNAEPVTQEREDVPRLAQGG